MQCDSRAAILEINERGLNPVGDAGNKWAIRPRVLVLRQGLEG